MKILVLNGPNLNLLGSRDHNTYGSNTLDQIRKKVNAEFPEIEMEWYQSNHEGDLIERIQQAKKNGFDGIVANWGGYTHSSVAIHDALETVDIPKVEVHISNIHGREEYREKSVTGRAMNGIITGFGSNSYILGIQAVKLITNKN